MPGEAQKNRSRFFPVLALAAGMAGVCLRFFHITQNDFFFYDEGYYLNLHRNFMELIAAHRPYDWGNFWGALDLCLRLSLGTGKALWFFISDLRVFWGGLEDWYFPRVVSALAGSLTLVPVFFFAKRFFTSNRAAWLSVIFLAVLPGHVFYSRLALQEALCAFFFLYGIYFYLFPERFGVRTFVSAALLVLAYFLNYRLIILPVIVFFCEAYLSFAEQRKPDVRKYFWHALIFIFLVFLIGNIDGGRNTVVTFAWMFHQAQLAEGQFDWLNFLSYPYYLFRLEGVMWGILFFGNIYFLLKREWKNAFLFCLACFYMAVFSLTADKAARYFCVMLPFVAMAAAFLVDRLGEALRQEYLKRVFWACIFLASFSSFGQSLSVAGLSSDYRKAAEYLKTVAPDPKVLTTQPWVQNLYIDRNSVRECPKDFLMLAALYREGFQYLVIDPQAYISLTADGRKFTPPLKGYLEFIVKGARPLKVFPHFEKTLLERFVFEHNENLRQSVAFLNAREQFGALRVYDIKMCFYTIGLYLKAQARNR